MSEFCGNPVKKVWINMLHCWQIFS
jgi:hypothetical protein